MVQALNTGANVDHEHTEAPDGHDQAMAEKFDAAQEKAVNPTGQPAETETQENPEDELILGKFKSQDELAEAYRNLESKLSGGKQDAEAQESSEGSQEEIDEAAKEAVDRAEGVDMESLSAEYFEKGALADESYEALEKAGIPRSMVDQFIEGQEARASQMGAEIMGQVGGEEAFGDMVEWASANLDGAFLDQYNAEVESGDPRRMEQAVKAVAYEYGQARPQEPSLMGGQGNSNGSTSGYQSMAQVTAAMSDPRYQKDPAYRAEVEQKLAASNVL